MRTKTVRFILPAIYTLALTLGCNADNSKTTTRGVLDSGIIATIPPPPVAESRATSLYSEMPSSLKILFVGNSYLGFNPTLDGLKTKFGTYNQISSLIDITVPETSSKLVSIGGGTLEQHWESGNTSDTARGYIESGQFDLLIIQGRYDIHREQSNADRFDTYIDQFSNLAKDNNMKVLLFGLWATDKQISPVQDLFGPVAHDIYRNAAVRNGISYAPNGIAYNAIYSSLANVFSEEEIEDSMTADAIHPNTPLAYLAANVVFYGLFGSQSPTFEDFRPPGISDELGELIRKVAWESAIAHGYDGR